MASLVAAVLGVVLAGRVRAATPLTPAEVQRGIRVLAGVSSEYQEAFDARGQLARPIEIDEVRLLLADLRDLTAHLEPTVDFAPATLLKTLGSLVDAHVPPPIIDAYVQLFRSQLIQTTGVREEIVPAERPSLARGREVFDANCAGCHGARGAGDGPDTARLGLKPANFTDAAFMQAQTPQDAFNVISLGRKKSGMPAWGEALSVQQIWDVVSYVWSLGRTADGVARGARVYAARCAGCHGAGGDPAEATAAETTRPVHALSSLTEGAARADADVFGVVSDGMPGTPMPAFTATLDERERRDVVAFVRVLSLEGAPGGARRSPEPDRAAVMASVGRMVETALDAHRRGDRGASALATSAYLRFEPLERPLADVDEARMQALEQKFEAFRTAIRDPSTGDALALGTELANNLTAAADLLRSPGLPAPPSARSSGPLLGAALLVTTGIAALVRYQRSRRR